MGKTILALLVIGLLLFVGILATQADEGGVVRFATLPPGPGHPEGIAADAKGNIYVATFDFSPSPRPTSSTSSEKMDVCWIPSLCRRGFFLSDWHSMRRAISTWQILAEAT